jgi:hypothetical protein
MKFIVIFISFFCILLEFISCGTQELDYFSLTTLRYLAKMKSSFKVIICDISRTFPIGI